MRPVTKVNPTTINPVYPFYTVPSLNAYRRFNANSAVSIAYNNDNVTPTDLTFAEMQRYVLDWDHNNLDWFAAGASNAEKNAAVRSLKKKLAKLYRPANRHLSAQLGDYCSYCEIHYPGHAIDVEHKIPKAPYPLRTLWWANFLQGCGRCNSAKGQRPSRANAIAWSGVVGPTENQIMAAALAHYFWPELTPDSFRRLSYQLCDGFNGYAVIPIAQAANRQNSLQSFNNYQVRANVQLAALAALTLNRHVEVTVGGSAIAAGMAPETAAQLTNTGLDVQASARAGYRTRTWFRVTGQMNIIFSSIYPNDPQAVKRRLFGQGWSLFMRAAQAFGHYSTIVTVLQQYPDPPYILGAFVTLADRFVNDSDPANAGAFEVYAGTNTAQVP